MADLDLASQLEAHLSLCAEDNEFGPADDYEVRGNHPAEKLHKLVRQGLTVLQREAKTEEDKAKYNPLDYEALKALGFHDDFPKAVRWLIGELREDG